MKIDLYQVDAFTKDIFKGNPAAVCPLPHWLPEDILQNIARENNLSETAFYVSRGEDYHLRWFTPSGEIDLCGHATLATAYVLRELTQDTRFTFQTQSGPLVVVSSGSLLEMDFPSRPVEKAADPGFGVIMGQPVHYLGKARDHLLLLPDQASLEDLQPDFSMMVNAGIESVICTARGDEADFVSRFFCPGFGIDEDPVTGSAHCTLVPYWSQKLGKRSLVAQQVSSRGGQLFCQDRGDRVSIAGEAVLYMKGELALKI